MGLLDRLADKLEGLAGGVAPEVRQEVERAMALADLGQLAAAELDLEQVARRHDRVALPHARLGEVRARRGDREGAAAAFGRAVDLAPDDGSIWLGLGEALAGVGRVEPASDALRRALALLPPGDGAARATAALGRLFLRAGRPGKAVRELRKAATLRPDDLTLAVDLGRALLADGESEGAAYLLRAAETDAAPGDVMVDAAAVAPEPERAERLLRRAHERLPDDSRVTAALARLLVRRGQTAAARETLHAALAAAPHDAGVVEAAGEVYAAAGDFALATQAARRAAELGRPCRPERLLALALGAGDEAEIARVLPDLPPGPLALAAAALVGGRADEAALALLAALAPDAASQRALVQRLAPASAPAGDLFGLLDYARHLAHAAPELGALAVDAARAVEAFDRPLIVAVMGEFNAGKSSFVNALLGREVAPVGVTPTTATVNILRHGAPGGRVIGRDGRARVLGGDEVGPFLRGLGDGAALVRAVEIFWPLEMLARVEIVDTPGLNSIRAEHEAVARAFLEEADAILWVFSIGQAAKATERVALERAHAAGKPVLGVLNKADMADASDVEVALGHVRRSLPGLLGEVLPFSARRALRAAEQRDEAGRVGSGQPALFEALERHFFSRAAALKRATAVGALTRFCGAAGALALAAAADPGPDLARRAAALLACSREVHSALSRERVALRARIAEAYRQAAFEVLEFVRPRSWILGEHRAAPADRDFLVDLLEDALARAAEPSRVALAAASAGGPPLPLVPAFERFAAYSAGVIEGGAVDAFFRHDLPEIALEAGAVAAALSRHAPDPEAHLLGPLGAAIEEAFRSAGAALAYERAAALAAAAIRRARVEEPLASLARALASLERP